MSAPPSVGLVHSWGTDQVELWLLKLGFEQDVRECLRSCGVDGQYLLRLDDLTLRCLGVERLGDRKRLLRRLRGITNSCFFLDIDPRTWTPDEVATWLKMCGLAEYSAQFELLGITGRRLLSLDEVALREMGVSKWGHRKQLLRRTAEARHSSRRRLRGRPAVAQWSERDVCDWLKLIQLADYRQVFVDHHIDGRRLTALTDTALVEDMGITTLGHRKRILKELRAAIAAGVAHHQRKAKPSDSPELGRTKSKRKRAELERL